jgi:hypothetical protein
MSRAKQCLTKRDASVAELEAQHASELPEREALSVLNPPVSLPVNVPAAVDLLASQLPAGDNAAQPADVPAAE